METKTDNELIAEFMQLPPLTEEEIGMNWNHSKCPYDTSWDWLMPVVEKIDKCYSLLPDSLEGEYIIRYDVLERAITNEWNIIDAYKAVVEFIKWYNQHGN